jgi:hypothetical protein
MNEFILWRERNTALKMEEGFLWQVATELWFESEHP